ncbi:nitric oxide reductase transcriptional regulator NorR [Vibrio barjaei]|uniref:Nitric oxide reductase transcriptional regulator NorR n=1 Tax=Vibrio barjaei TaxID=1676683 RepID=A0ABW7IMT7_9VIBR|nr:nitric oxide reductase transcriptional regulator NorR [Vibrio barjaei]MCY9873232.1 nitric oxide reductase transcriptional regulator NorR [Vibrio barjaei]OIN28840.1 nitric oxide reductase transcription regulator [Vibrio barjaei]
MSQFRSAWLQIALDITSGISEQDRFDRLLSTIRQVLQCDAAALLKFDGKSFVPLATDGLSADVLGRRFEIDNHPRFEAIARAGDIVRFPANSDLADPYDGLIPNHEGNLEVHSCVGLPLLLQDNLIGAITIDAFNPTQFDTTADKDLRILSALAANSLHTALLVEKLERSGGISESSSSTKLARQDAADIIGQSRPMGALKQEISAVADTDLSVLIIGETGTGKELVAQSIYSQSSRKDEALVYLNCAALPESVAESELFGHIKGSFTGAISNRKGKFELANKGTLFLDEIGELSLGLQAKLLRALQYGDIQRVGDDRNIKVDVRIIAATNRVMHEEVKAGRFRADLYHRLSVFPIFVPPLKEREGDIVLLSGFFAERCQHKLKVSSISLSDEALSKLQAYDWPGNVRELEHAINRGAVIAKAQSTSSHVSILAQHITLDVQSEQHQRETEPQFTSSGHTTRTLSTSASLKDAVDEFQTQYVRKAFSDNNQNLSATAKQLSVNPGNLHRLMKRLNLK